MNIDADQFEESKNRRNGGEGSLAVVVMQIGQ
jgi:hypothetical protein